MHRRGVLLCSTVATSYQLRSSSQCGASVETVGTSYSVTVVEHDGFQEINLGPRSSPITRNSVVVIPNVLRESECKALLQAAQASSTAAKGAPPLQRLPVASMNEAAKGLSDALLKERILPFMTARLPGTVCGLFGASLRLERARLAFSGSEPTINVYHQVGQFEPHADRYTLTVIIALDSGFKGGGTRFWPQGASPGSTTDDTCSAVVRVPPGTALLFNGDVLHAGVPVTNGVRHLYVASFDLLHDGRPNLLEFFEVVREVSARC